VRELEICIFDVNTTGTAAAAKAFTNLQLTNIAQGAGYNQRDGVNIAPKRLRFAMEITMDTSGSSDFRVILARTWYDQSAMSSTDAVSPSGGNAYNVVGAYNRDFIGQSRADSRLEILDDRIFEGNLGAKCNYYYSVEIPLGGLIRYLQSNATSVPVDGGIGLWYCGGSTTATLPAFVAYSRLFYVDA
jgi:hypothetical protein